MDQPQCFTDTDNPNHICRLRKAIYGLKEAPRAWYNELKLFLLTSGFLNSNVDTSLFILHSTSVSIYLLVYVDDIIITSNNPSTVQHFITLLSCRFSLKDLGVLTYFLSIEVLPHLLDLIISQRRYIVDLLARTIITDARPISTPLSTTPILFVQSGTTLSDPSEFRTIAESLQYLSITRPDIAYAVNKLSQFIHRRTGDH